MEKTYNVKVTAESEQKCLEKITAVTAILNNKELLHEDLLELAQLLKEKPGVVAKAKSLKSWF